MQGRKIFLCLLILGLGAVQGSQRAFSVLPGTVVSDARNYWGHNGKLADPGYKATYVVCDGYVGSPLIPDARDAIATFANNCETTPPPGSLPIIAVPENNSPNYKGYPAYPVTVSQKTYFLCDGFLNSTAWCSYEAHIKAQKLLRAAESRYWEAGENPMIIDDIPVDESYNRIIAATQGATKQVTWEARPVQVQQLQPQRMEANRSQTTVPLSKEQLKSLNIPEGSKVIPIDPSKIDPSKLPPGAYIKAVPVNQPATSNSREPFYSSKAQRQIDEEPTASQNSRYVQNDNAVKKVVLGDDLKYFLVQEIERAVERAIDKRFPEGYNY